MISGSKKILSVAVKSVAAASLLLLAASPAEAQRQHHPQRETNANRKARIARTIDETYGHRWEAAGGGGYMRFRSGQYLQQNNEVSFFGTARYSLNQNLGVLGEVSGYFGNAKIGTNPYLNQFGKPFNPQVSQYTFTAGPSYHVMKREKYAVTPYVTGGIALGKFDSGSHGFTASNLGLWQDGWSGVMTAGVNLDYNFYPNFAMRVTPKFVGTFFDGTVQPNRGFDLGLVYRFGKTK